MDYFERLLRSVHDAFLLKISGTTSTPTATSSASSTSPSPSIIIPITLIFPKDLPQQKSKETTCVGILAWVYIPRATTVCSKSWLRSVQGWWLFLVPNGIIYEIAYVNMDRFHNLSRKCFAQLSCACKGYDSSHLHLYTLLPYTRHKLCHPFKSSALLP